VTSSVTRVAANAGTPEQDPGVLRAERDEPACTELHNRAEKMVRKEGLEPSASQERPENPRRDDVF
jgi:hypothetical protein